MEMQQNNYQLYFQTQEELKRRRKYQCDPQSRNKQNWNHRIQGQRRQPREHTPDTIQWECGKIKYDPENNMGNAKYVKKLRAAINAQCNTTCKRTREG